MLNEIVNPLASLTKEILSVYQKQKEACYD